MLAELPLSGAVVTGDALYCQRRVCAPITAAGGDSLVVVKGNPPRLHQDIRTLFEAPPPETTFGFVEQRDRHGDRQERRRVWTSGELFGYLVWPGAHQVGKIQRRVWHQGRSAAKCAPSSPACPLRTPTGASRSACTMCAT
jgi:hypothetical protein